MYKFDINYSNLFYIQSATSKGLPTIRCVKESHNFTHRITHLQNEFSEYFDDLLTECKTRKLLICGLLNEFSVVFAERVGFEPTVQFNPYDDLANRSFRPLRLLSKIPIYSFRPPTGGTSPKYLFIPFVRQLAEPLQNTYVK